MNFIFKKNITKVQIKIKMYLKKKYYNFKIKICNHKLKYIN